MLGRKRITMGNFDQLSFVQGLPTICNPEGKFYR